MADELSLLPEDTGGGVIDIAKKIALNKAAQIAKEALQAVDKTGVITSQLTEDDLIEIGTGIQKGDKDKIKNVIGINLEKIQSSIPSTILAASGVNLLTPQLMAANMANQLVQLGGGIAEGLAEWDIGDNFLSKTGEGIFDMADIAMNNPNYGIATLGGNIMSDLNRAYGNTVLSPLSWAGQKIYDYTDPFFNLLGYPFQGKKKSKLEEVLSQNLQQTDNIPIGGINQPNVITNDDGTQTLTGGTTDPSDDIIVTNLPPQVPRPTMADVAGPSTLTNNDINQIINDQIQLTGGGGNTGQTLGPVGMGSAPPSPRPRPRPTHHFAQGGLASMARVLRR